MFNRPNGVPAQKTYFYPADTPFSSPEDTCERPLIADVITRNFCKILLSRNYGNGFVRHRRNGRSLLLSALYETVKNCLVPMRSAVRFRGNKACQGLRQLRSSCTSNAKPSHDSTLHDIVASHLHDLDRSGQIYSRSV